MSPNSNKQEALANGFAKPMFLLSLVYLLLVAALIVVWVDMPRVEFMALENAELVDAELLETQRATIKTAATLGGYVSGLILLLYPVFWAEIIIKWSQSGLGIADLFRQRRYDLLIAICPPLRLAASTPEMANQIWLPKLGWRHPGKPLTKQLERFFGKPMLMIALLILPVLLVEFGLKSVVDKHLWLRIVLHVCTGLIWCAFAIEFLIMISATDKKLNYIKANWIDLAIILLPLISFLRSLRAIRAMRVAKLAKFQQLAKMGRIYRLRGLLTKSLRALMLLEFLNRLFRITPETKLEKLLVKKEERLEELAELDEEITQLRAEIEMAKQDEVPPETPESSNDAAA